eukprot:SAG31_NODE_1468_length_8223_cov_37.850320_5_plen_123_part_00
MLGDFLVGEQRHMPRAAAAAELRGAGQGGGGVQAVWGRQCQSTGTAAGLPPRARAARGAGRDLERRLPMMMAAGHHPHDHTRVRVRPYPGINAKHGNMHINMGSWRGGGRPSLDACGDANIF